MRTDAISVDCVLLQSRNCIADDRQNNMDVPMLHNVVRMNYADDEQPQTPQDKPMKRNMSGKVKF